MNLWCLEADEIVLVVEQAEDVRWMKMVNGNGVEYDNKLNTCVNDVTFTVTKARERPHSYLLEE